MNLSVLERMAQDGDMSADAIRYLLNCKGECEWLDYKELLVLENEKELCDFARDILGMKNVGGGYIIVGVQDQTWVPLGLKAPLPYDTKLLRDKIRRAAGIDLDVDIVNHQIQEPGSTGLFALIFVRASRKRRRRRTPTLVGKDFCASKPFGLRRGDIYCRRGDSTVKIQKESELEDLLDSLEALADHDTVALSGRSSPFAVEEGLYRLLEKGFESFIGRSALRQSVLTAITKDPRLWIINIHGPGGVGKSALVNWVTYELFHQKAFEAIIQLTAKDTVLTADGIQKFGRSLYSLENLLDHIIITFQQDVPTDLDGKKKAATEILSAWKTLLVLDNMESVQDGRILNFARELPPDTKAKVVLTSRHTTGGWELPISVQELDKAEVQEFLRLRSKEMSLDFPCDDASVGKVWGATGGLPLAIQWVLGRYKVMPNLDRVAAAVMEKDSPVLEFSFRNIWQVISSDAKAVLAILSIFEEPPTDQQIAIATEFGLEKIERALMELSDVTLVSKSTQVSDGRITYVALPITLSFARHQLREMGDFEIDSRRRFQKYTNEMSLQRYELKRFTSHFSRFGLESENEKRAAILCQRGESEMFMGNLESAALQFKLARDLAPQSAYVYAMSANFELNGNRIGEALAFANEACKRASGKTGSLCYTVKARILDKQHDRSGRLAALEKALGYDPEDAIARHQYGVALSRVGKPAEAVEQFSVIIEKEKNKIPPTPQLLMALKTRMMNLQRLGRKDELKKDVALVSDIFKKYSYLAREAERFAEFFETPPSGDRA